MLWKTMQLANYPVASLLLDHGLGAVDHQMFESGETCLIKALKEDVKKDDSVCVNNEKDREEILRFLLEDGEEWWSDPTLPDRDGHDAFYHSAKLALREDIADYMNDFAEAIEENKGRDSALQRETRPEALKARLGQALLGFRKGVDPKGLLKPGGDLADKLNDLLKAGDAKNKDVKKDKDGKPIAPDAAK